MKTFAKIRFYWGSFAIVAVVSIFMIPLTFFFKNYKGQILHIFNKVNLFLMGAKVKQDGEMDYDADMYIMNHQGIIDIIGWEALQTRHVSWVAKKELFDATWFGNVMKNTDMISLDRGSRSGLLKLLKDIKSSINDKNRPVAIFPEGTRADGQEVLPFKKGTNMIANKLKLKVQPVIITGSKWVLNEHDKTAHNGTVHYKFLPTIDVTTQEKDWFDKLYENMQKAIDDELSNSNRSR